MTQDGYAPRSGADGDASRSARLAHDDELADFLRRELARLDFHISSLTGRTVHTPENSKLLEGHSADQRWPDMDVVRRWSANPRRAREGLHAGRLPGDRGAGPRWTGSSGGRRAGGEHRERHRGVRDPWLGPLVLINGMGFGRWGFFKQVPALSRRFAPVTFDAREGRNPEGVIEGLARDVVSLLDHLGVNRAPVLGASLGGFVAQKLALGRPDLVGRRSPAGASTTRRRWGV